MEKEEKIIDKLLPIRVDNTITIYHVKYKEKDVRKCAKPDRKAIWQGCYYEI